MILEDFARYAAFLLAPAHAPPLDFGRGFFALSEKQELFYIFCCWYFLVTSVTFSSNLSNYDKNQKNQKRIQKSDFF